MSCATKIPVPESLKSNFRSAASSGSKRFFVIRIENEQCVEVYSHPSSASLQTDWNAIASKAGDAAAYVLVRLDGEKNWLTITYVPSSTKIKDKMVYAATKSTLLETLGFQYFASELHANDQDELSWAYYQGTLKPADARSNQEKAMSEMNEQEEEERQWRIQQQKERQSIISPTGIAAAGRGRGRGRGLSSSGGVGGAASRGGVASSAGGRPLAASGGARPVTGIGGFHAVEISLADSATQLLQQYQRGEYNFVTLKINDSKDGVDGAGGKQVSSGSLSSSVHTTEPRFYVYKHNGSNVFIYCCPENSPRALRMVYSTAKGSVADHCSAAGVEISKSVEASDPSEVNDSLFASSSASYSSSSSSSSSSTSTAPWVTRAGRGMSGEGLPEGGGSVQARAVSKVDALSPHPVYSMMGSNPNRLSKKIVLPPKGAWS